MAAEGHTRRWSGILTLNQVVSRGCLPTLIQLEEGYRGPQETLSLSSGDIMALQSCLTVRRRKMVLAYYMEDTAIAEWLPDEMPEDYRKLVALPLHKPEIAEMEVRQLDDPSGDIYRHYVNSHFRDWSASDIVEELQKLLESTNYYNEISVYTYVDEFLRRENTPEQPIGVNQPQDTETPPPLPPRPAGNAGGIRNQSDHDTPPALPPRSPHRPVADPQQESIYEISDDDVTEPQTGAALYADTTGTTAKTTTRREYVEFPAAPPQPQGALTRETRSPARNPPSDSDDNSDFDTYAEVDEAKMVDRVGQLTQQTPAKPSSATNSTEQPRGQGASRPIGRVPPNLAPTTPFLPPQRQPVTDCSSPSPYPEIGSRTKHGLPKIKRAIEEMTVTQLCACLDNCGMKGLAEACRIQRLDGSYLCSMSDDSLSKSPFLLQPFDLDKLRRIKLGWRPNLG